MASQRKNVEKQIAETFGFVPEFYEAMPDAAVGGAWTVHSDLELSETKLDNKTKELIGLAIASHLKCKYCIYFHQRASAFHGATEEEQREAIAMGGVTVLFSNSLTGTGTDYDRFKRDVDRALEAMSGRSAKKR